MDEGRFLRRGRVPWNGDTPHALLKNSVIARSREPCGSSVETDKRFKKESERNHTCRRELGRLGKFFSGGGDKRGRSVIDRKLKVKSQREA